MTDAHHTRLGRRPVLKGAGATLAALGGLGAIGTAAAKSGNGHGPGHLNDLPADITLLWSVDGTTFDPFFQYTDGTGNDPTNIFDFSQIEMSPNGGTLHNAWTFFYGRMLASKPKPYPLVHQGGGVYRSEGQVMKFDVQTPDGVVSGPYDIDALRYPPIEQVPHSLWGTLFPPVAELAGGTWRAVGTEEAVLELDGNGDPTANPAYAATRIDVYTTGHPEYVLSLLYVIAQHGVPEYAQGAYGLAASLIAGGRLNPGGQ